MLALDNYITKELTNLAPYKSAFDLNKPYKISSVVAIPKPVIATIANFLHYRDDPSTYDPRKIAATQALAIQ